jgi:hypothetical protein
MRPPTPKHTTVPKGHPPKQQRPKAVLGRPRPKAVPPTRSSTLKPTRAQIGRIIDESEQSLVDVIDSLLNQGVMLNAEIVLALANVDLVYLRLSALLCASDRILPSSR